MLDNGLEIIYTAVRVRGHQQWSGLNRELRGRIFFSRDSNSCALITNRLTNKPVWLSFPVNIIIINYLQYHFPVITLEFIRFSREPIATVLNTHAVQC